MEENLKVVLEKWMQGSSYCNEREKGSVVNYLHYLVERLEKEIDIMKQEIKLLKEVKENGS